MGMGTMMNPQLSVGIPWGFSNGFQITWKRVKYSTFFCNLFYWNLMLTVVVLVVVQCYLISARWYVNLCFDMTVHANPFTD